MVTMIFFEGETLQVQVLNNCQVKSLKYEEPDS